MNRLAGTAALLLVVYSVGVTNAEEPHREWLDFFEGQWKIDWDGEWDQPQKFEYTKGKFALAGEFTTPDGTHALAVYAWDAGKKALLFNWFDSRGNYARQEYTVIKADHMSGLVYRSGPDGPSSGNAVIQRFGRDKYTVTLKTVAPDGTLTETSGELTRQK